MSADTDGTADMATVAELHRLPAMIDVETAASILGIGRTLAYQLAKSNEFPCRVIRLGRLYRVSTADLIRLVGASAEHPTSGR
jgi:excisionase family DNA binding protein